MPKMKAVKAKFEKHSRYRTPRRIYDIAAEPSKETPRKVAEKILKKLAKELGIGADLSQLKFDKVNESVLGHHVLFQQHEAKRPITGAWVKVDIDQDGRVLQVLSDLVPRTFLEKSAKKGKGIHLDHEAATQIALKATGCTKKERKSEVLTTEQVMFPGDKGPDPAWKVVVRAYHPRAEWKVYVDADNGEVLSKVSLLKHATGTAQVFDPNPVVSLNDTGLKDNSTIPATAYVGVILLDLESSGHLDGKFVTTKRTPGRVKRGDREFQFERGDKGFNEVMVYFHIDRVQRYIQELGFDNILNGGIEVNARGTPADNSFYSPTTKALEFGTGGVDDAEDADIILHEYGHAIQDDQVPGFGETEECRAMGEGFGDYLAGSFYADLKTDVLKPCIGSWDATSYSGDEPPSLRRLDSNKKYPKDIVGEEHDDGEIWAACLWQLRGKLGRRMADRLVLAHHFLISRTASFEDAANGLLTADQTLNQGVNRDAIRAIFVARGILKNPKRKNRRAGARSPFAKK